MSESRKAWESSAKYENRLMKDRERERRHEQKEVQRRQDKFDKEQRKQNARFDSLGPRPSQKPSHSSSSYVSYHEAPEIKEETDPRLYHIGFRIGDETESWKEYKAEQQKKKEEEQQKEYEEDWLAAHKEAALLVQRGKRLQQYAVETWDLYREEIDLIHRRESIKLNDWKKATVLNPQKITGRGLDRLEQGVDSGIARVNKYFLDHPPVRYVYFVLAACPVIASCLLVLWASVQWDPKMVAIGSVATLVYAGLFRFVWSCRSTMPARSEERLVLQEVYRREQGKVKPGCKCETCRPERPNGIFIEGVMGLICGAFFLGLIIAPKWAIAGAVFLPLTLLFVL